MNRRPIVGIVIAVLLVLGIIGIGNATYRAGVMEGMWRGAQMAVPNTVPNENGDGTRVVPAPRTAPYGYGAPAPFGYGNPGFGWGNRGGFGGFGGFGILGGLLHVLLIGGIILLVTRVFFRGAFGWGRWGRGWGGPGREPWGRRGDDDKRDDKRERDEFRDSPKRRDDEVI